MRKLIAGLLLSVAAAIGQSSGPAKSGGPCSPANTGSNNTFLFYNVRCDGVSKEQGDILVKIMNEVLTRQLDEKGTLESIQRTLESSANSGFLVPGSEGSPPNICNRYFTPALSLTPASPDFWKASASRGTPVYLFLGGSVSFATRFPHTVVQAGRKAFLSLDEKADGLSISLEAYDEDHKIMVAIVDNEFSVNPNRVFRKIIGPGGHSLSVLGENNQEVLNVKFLNPYAISILADFYLPDGQRLYVSPSEWKVGRGPTFHGVCLGDSGGADIRVP